MRAAIDSFLSFMTVERGVSPNTLYSIEEGLVAIKNATLPSVKTIQSGRNSIGGDCFQQTADRLVYSTRSIVLSDFGLNFPLAVPFYIAPAESAP